MPRADHTPATPPHNRGVSAPSADDTGDVAEPAADDAFTPTQIAGQVAHDLKEPLHVVAGYLDLLLAHHEHRLNLPDAPSLVREARDATERMHHVIEDLMQFTRDATISARFSAFPLDAAVDDALAALGPRMRERGGEIVRGTLPVVHGDRVQLARVFQNLLANALKFAKPGQAARVTITSETREEGVEIIVTDEGLGLPANGRERLFQPFARLHPDVAGGSGLGLASCRTIVHRHGGRIWATDAPTRGAAFHFTLPREEAP